jgi:type I restriction enzyme R subunit
MNATVQFGETHERITKFFEKSQLFSLQEHPYLKNASKWNGERTTKDLFGTANNM